MDTKRLIYHIAVALVLISGWWLFREYINRTHPEYAQEMAAQEAAAQNPATAPSATTQPSGPAFPTTSPGSTSMPQMSAGVHVVASTQTTTALLGSAVEKDPKYAMQIVLSSTGAGIQKVTLNQFHQTVRDAKLYSFQEPYDNHPETAPLATRSVTVDGTSVDTLRGWTLTHSDPSSATFTVPIAINDHPIARLTKKFTLPDIPSSAKTSDGYEVQVDYSVENLTDHAINVRTETNGPTVPPKEVERGTDQQVLAGYNTSPTIRVVQHPIEEFRKDKINQDLTASKDQPLAWAGTASVYFNALVLPETSPSAAATTYSVNATNIDPDTETPSAVAMEFQTGQVSVAAGATAQLPLSVFFGPKERKVLETSYFSAFPRQYNNTLVITSGFCGFCTFPWLIQVLVAMLTFFHWIVRDWGLAIICLVAIVRTLLHPIAKKSQIQMAKMSKMGPEMERLKQKYGDDKDALNKAMMQYYKEQGPAQILGCLPMFLQTPIWIALWSALQSTFELRHSPFLAFGPVHLTWIRDLANPDALINFSSPLHLPVFGEISSVNLLPLLLGVVFYFQQKFTPKPVAATAEQQQQQKMMTWMSTLMFPLFLYKGPAGLNLYILTSTAIGIIEGKVIRDHIKQREEAEKAGRVFVDAKPTRGSKRKDKDKNEPPKKKTGIAGWLSDLQARAEEIRRQAEKGK